MRSLAHNTAWWLSCCYVVSSLLQAVALDRWNEWICKYLPLLTYEDRREKNYADFVIFSPRVFMISSQGNEEYRPKRSREKKGKPHVHPTFNLLWGIPCKEIWKNPSEGEYISFKVCWKKDHEISRNVNTVRILSAWEGLSERALVFTCCSVLILFF